MQVKTFNTVGISAEEMGRALASASPEEFCTVWRAFAAALADERTRELKPEVLVDYARALADDIQKDSLFTLSSLHQISAAIKSVRRMGMKDPFISYADVSQPSVTA